MQVYMYMYIHRTPTHPDSFRGLGDSGLPTKIKTPTIATPTIGSTQIGRVWKTSDRREQNQGETSVDTELRLQVWTLASCLSTQETKDTSSSSYMYTSHFLNLSRMSALSPALQR